jgi:hypothetical protein
MCDDARCERSTCRNASTPPASTTALAAASVHMDPQADGLIRKRAAAICEHHGPERLQMDETALHAVRSTGSAAGVSWGGQRREPVVPRDERECVSIPPAKACGG